MARRIRSSKSTPPLAATAASYATNARATGPASGSAATAAAETPSSTLSREIAVSSRRMAASSAHGATWRRTAARSASGSTDTPASRRISRPSAWNVRTRTVPGPTPSGATAASRRSVISTAARLLKVIARIRSGRRARRDQPGGAGDQGRRLAGARRRDAQRRPGRGGRRGPLVRRQAGETVGDRRGKVQAAIVRRRPSSRAVTPPPSSRCIGHGRAKTADSQARAESLLCDAPALRDALCPEARRIAPVHMRRWS